MKQQEQPQHIKPQIVRFFQAYTTFFHVDLESALLEGRNFDIINLFRINFYLLIDIDADVQKVNKSLHALETLLQDEQLNYQSINTYDKKSLNYSDALPCLKEAMKYFIAFDEAYQLLYNTFSQLDEDRKFQDILVEFNNALSHILSSFYIKDETNCKKAVSHLYRAILDCYKEIIHKNYNLVRIDKKMINDEHIFNYFIDTRKIEAENIGKREDVKFDLVSRYKNIAWSLLN